MADHSLDKPDAAPGSPETVRRSSRVYFRLRAEAVIYPLFPTQKPKRAVVMTCDLSRSGLKIRHSSQLTPGQQIDLLLGDKQRRAEVVWCQRHTDRQFVIGCRFVRAKAGQ